MGFLDFLFTPDVAKLEKKEDIDGLIKALSYRKDEKIRFDAVKALGKLQAEKAVKTLIRILSNKNEKKSMRKEVVIALGKIKDNRSVDSLIPLLKDHDKNYRHTAVTALSMIGDRRAVAPLLQAFKYGNKEIHGELAEALGRFGDAKAVKPLKEAINSSTKSVRKKIEKALKRIEAKDQFHYSRFAEDLCCKHCGEINETGEWPLYGDSSPFKFQTEPGEYSHKINCHHCNESWYVVWKADPGPIKTLVEQDN